MARSRAIHHITIVKCILVGSYPSHCNSKGVFRKIKEGNCNKIYRMAHAPLLQLFPHLATQIAPFEYHYVVFAMVRLHRERKNERSTC